MTKMFAKVFVNDITPRMVPGDSGIVDGAQVLRTRDGWRVRNGGREYRYPTAAEAVLGILNGFGKDVRYDTLDDFLEEERGRE